MDSIVLSNAAPCTADLETIIASGCGKYCNTCQKIVHDFTAMSDEQLSSIIQRHDTKSLCILLDETQWNRPLSNRKAIVQNIKSSKSVSMTLFSTLLPIAIFDQANALQGNKADFDSQWMIDFITNNENTKPLNNIEIRIKELGIGFPDAKGWFRFRIPNHFEKTKLSIEVNVIEYAEAHLICEQLFTQTLQLNKGHLSILPEQIRGIVSNNRIEKANLKQGTITITSSPY